MPADPYLVSPSGRDLRRLALLSLDDLAIAWSPDGEWLAASGAAGLWLVRATDGSVRQVTTVGSFGSIDWR